jgi:hypothetical protein
MGDPGLDASRELAWHDDHDVHDRLEGERHCDILRRS